VVCKRGGAGRHPRVVGLSALLIAILLSLLCAPVGAAATAVGPNIPFERYRLKNGLEVILSQNRRLPRVAVNLRYKVGSASDAPGRMGAAHVYEHLYAFSRNRIATITPEAVGATQVGATTEYDRTTYYTTLPSARVDVALAVESERMRDIGALIDEPLLRRELKAVRNERRMVVDNKPHGLADEAVIQSLYPAGHPYHHLYIGAHPDIQAVSLDDARAYFARYYVPGNAILSIAGDFDVPTMKAMVDKYFGAIPAGPTRVARTAAVGAGLPWISSEQRVTVYDTVDRPRLSMAWGGVANYAPGSAEADMLAVILGHGSISRLYRSLVVEKGLAQDVSVQNLSFELGSAFIISAPARPNVSTDQIEAAIDLEIARLQSSGPTADEVTRARNTMELRVVRGLEQLGNITAIADPTLESPYGGVAEQLSECSYFTGDPGCLTERVGHYRRATAASVRAVARTLFGPARVVVSAMPGAKVVDDPPAPPETDKAAIESEAPAAPAPGRDVPALPAGGDKVGASALPIPIVHTLPNGLKVYIVRDRAAPVVTAALLVKGGTSSSPTDRPGLAPFVADMLTQGAKRRTAGQVAYEVAQLGTSVDIDSNREAVALRMRVLISDLPSALDILADIALYPSFPQEAIDRIRRERLQRIADVDATPDGAASHTFTTALYGPSHPFSSGGLFNDILFARKHPYGYDDLGTLDSLRAIDRADLIALHRRSFVPDNAALIIVGNVTEAEIDALSRRYFGAWSGHVAPSAPVAAGSPAAAGLIVKDIGPVSQTALRIGGPGASRADPDALATRMMNVIFGEVYASRLTTNLRVSNGYTYMVRSRFAFGQDKGPFVIGTSVRSDATRSAIDEIFSEMKRIRTEPVTGEELAFSRKYVENALFEQFETSSSTAMTIGDMFLYDLPGDYYPDQLKRVQTVGPQDIIKAAQQHLRPDQMIVVGVGDARLINAAAATGK